MTTRRRCALSSLLVLVAATAYAAGPATPASATHSRCTREAATILGTPGDDVLKGTDGEDIIVGLGGDDRIVAGANDETEYHYDRICGGGGDDVLVGHQDDPDGRFLETEAIVVGGPGNDRLLGGIAFDGGPGNDELRGRGGRDELFGGPGNDVIDGGKPDDGPGHAVDVVIFRDGPVTADLVKHRARGEGRDRLIGIEQLIGTPQDDVFRGDEDSNFLDGRGGSDTVSGGGGDDVLVPDGLNDRDAGRSFETVIGGPGRDMVAFGGYYDGATVNLAEGTMRVGAKNTGRIDEVEDVQGSMRPDVLVGDDADNRLFGRGRADVLEGGDGDDVLLGDESYDRGADVMRGGAGDDHLEGMKGDDVLDGGGGVDTASFYADRRLGGVTASLVTGVATGQGDDELAGIENLWGSARQDRLEGDEGDNRLRSNGGEDYSDTLIGHGGDDVLETGRGDDTLDGGAGNDLASYAGSFYAVTIDLAAGTATTEDAVDLLLSIENAIGSKRDDTISGDGLGNRLDGLDGNDMIFGRDGDDTISGGPGTDTIAGGTGTDDCTEGEATLGCE
jgi:Ca2+-binding RTX toxin-like protein